jgi:hypothetical protein
MAFCVQRVYSIDFSDKGLTSTIVRDTRMYARVRIYAVSPCRSEAPCCPPAGPYRRVPLDLGQLGPAERADVLFRERVIG